MSTPIVGHAFFWREATICFGGRHPTLIPLLHALCYSAIISVICTAPSIVSLIHFSHSDARSHSTPATPRSTPHHLFLNHASWSIHHPHTLRSRFICRLRSQSPSHAQTPCRHSCHLVPSPSLSSRSHRFIVTKRCTHLRQGYV